MPPEYPESESYSQSNSKSFTFGSSIPTVTSLNGYLLGSLGWKHEKGNRYKKGNSIIEFDGVRWMLNSGKKIQFLHELEEELNKK